MTTAALGVAGALAMLGAVWLWVRRRLVVVTVEGPSMQPTLCDGDRVLVRRTPLTAVRTGQLVVVRPPLWTGPYGEPARWVIKRAAAVGGDPVPAQVRAILGKHDERVPAGCLVVLGDNPAQSADSRHWGCITEQGMLGVVHRPMPSQPPTAAHGE